MRVAIGYLRVSTKEQGRSGLGLEAQRRDIVAFGAREGYAVKSWHEDHQTGAGADALLLRPGLATALQKAKAERCPLIVSRLDRLSRNVHFITGLMEHKVHFMVAALGRDCDAFTLHIYASLAEQERKMISERCKAAAVLMKARGRRFGLQVLPKAQQRRISAMGRALQSKMAMERTESYRMHIEWALRQPGRLGRPIAYRAAAIRLNERHLESPMGGTWRGLQLKRMAQRLGIDHPTAHIPADVARARIQEIWAQNPDVTGDQVKARLRLPHPVGTERIRQFLKECRKGATTKGPALEKEHWFFDRFTATRVRVGALWTRHPEFTGKQILAKLGPDCTLRLKWVQKILRDYWRASVRFTPHQRRHGRQFQRPSGNRYRVRQTSGRQSTPRHHQRQDSA
jgi:DNA invertase Pin-like site-specific DNA recombinase